MEGSDNDHEQSPSNERGSPTNEEQDGNESRQLNHEVVSSIRQLRNGQHPLSPSHHQLQPSHPHTSPLQPPLSLSQSLDLSPQPGPSGLHFISHPTVSHDQSHDPLHGSHDQSSRVTHSAFRVPPSQDVFATGGDITFDLEASQSEESQSVPPGPPSRSHMISEPRPPNQPQPHPPGPPSPPVLIPGPDIASHLEQHSRYIQQYQSWYEKDKQNRQSTELKEFFQQTDEVKQEQADPPQAHEVVSSQEREGSRSQFQAPRYDNPLLQNASDELASRHTRNILRRRHAHVRVPGTESSQSSDDACNFGVESREAAITKAIIKTCAGVPESKLATTQYSYKEGDHALAGTTTASSESEVEKLQALSQNECEDLQVEKIKDKISHVPRAKKSKIKRRQAHIEETRAPPVIIAEPFICTSSSIVAPEVAGSFNEGDDEMTETDTEHADDLVTGDAAMSEGGEGVISEGGDVAMSEGGEGVISEGGETELPAGSRERVTKPPFSMGDRRRRKGSGTPVIRAALPSWGAADTDTSTDYPATQTSSSSGTTSSSSAGANISGLSVGLSLDHTSSQMEGDSQPASQTIPISSTPHDLVVMPPPSSLLTPSKNKSSSETTTSSSSGSGGHLVKTRSNTTWPSLESIPESEQSVGNEQETTSPPLARQTPSPPQSIPRHTENSTIEAISSTPDEQVDLDLSQIIQEPSCSVAVVRGGGMFHSTDDNTKIRGENEENSESQDDLGNQMPKWCMSEAESRDGDEETDSVTSPTKRPIHSSLSGSDGPASLSPHPPPAKRRKEEPQPRGTKSYSSSAQTPRWQRDSSSNTAANIGPSLQAQPTTIPSVSSKKSTTSASQDGTRDISSSPSAPNRSITSSSGSSAVSSTYPASSSCDPSSQPHSAEVLSGQSSTPSGSNGSSHSASQSVESASVKVDTACNFSGVSRSQGGVVGEIFRENEITKVTTESCAQPVSQSTQDSFLNTRKMGAVLGLADFDSSIVKNVVGSQVPAEVFPAQSLLSESVDMFEESVSHELESQHQSTSQADTTGNMSATAVPPADAETKDEMARNVCVTDVPPAHVAKTEMKDEMVVPPVQDVTSQDHSGYQVVTEFVHSPIVIESPPRHDPIAEDHHTSLELLPEPSESPDIVQTSAGKEEPECSEEIAVQAPCTILQTEEQQASTSTTTHSEQQGTEESMEVEMFSQSNFALRLSQSQSVTPIIQSQSVTPISQSRHIPNNGINKTMPLVAYSASSSLEEIEEHEKECPNLFAVERDTSMLSEADKSASEDKGSVSSSQRNKSDTSLSSSSSQGQKTGSGSGSDSTPPGSGTGGIGGTYGSCGSDSGAAGEAGEGVSEEEPGKENTSRNTSDNNSTDAHGATVIKQQQLQLNVQPPIISDAQKSKPVPLYESVTYDSEVVEAHDHSMDCGIATPMSVAQSSMPAREISDRLRQVTADVRESQQSADLSSQATSSGTPFQFRLPQDGFLHPTTSMTPPSENTTPLTPPLITDTSLPPSTHQPSLPPAVTQSTVTMLSPTEINTNIFRPITPSPQISQTKQPQATTVVSQPTPSNKTLSSNTGSTNLSSLNACPEKEAAKTTTTLITTHSQCNDEDTQPGANSQTEDLPDVICVGVSSPTKRLTVEQSKVALTPKRVADTKLSNSASPSPRRSLSLKKTKAINTSTSIRKQLIVEAQQVSNKSKEAGFVLGMDSQQDSSQLTDPRVLNSDIPAIEVRESQFEFSEDSNTLFQIEKPSLQANKPAQPQSNYSTNKVSVSSDVSHNTNLFSNFKASETSRKASKQARGSSSTLNVSNSLYNTRQDPYEHSSQSERPAEVEFKVRKQKSTIVALSKHKESDGEDVSGTQDKTNKFSKLTNERWRDDSQGNRDGLDSAGDEVTRNDSESQQLDTSSSAAEGVIDHGSVKGGAQCEKDVVKSSHHPGGSVKSQILNERTSQVESSSQTQATKRSTSTPLTAHIQIPSTSQSNVINATPVTSQRGPFASPLPSASLMEFNSPNAIISPANLEELKRPFSETELKSYELHHVMVIRTVVEERVISSEVVRNGRVVPGSCKVCHVHERTEPQTSHESFELTPLPPTTASIAAPLTPSRTTSVYSKALTTSTSHPTCPSIMSPLPQQQRNTSFTSSHAPLNSEGVPNINHNVTSGYAGRSIIQSPTVVSNPAFNVGSVHTGTSTHLAPGAMSPIRLVRPVLPASNTSTTSITSHYQQLPLPSVQQGVTEIANRESPIGHLIDNGPVEGTSSLINCQEDPLPCMGKTGVIGKQSSKSGSDAVIELNTVGTSQVSASNEAVSYIRRSHRKSKESLAAIVKKRDIGKGWGGKAKDNAGNPSSTDAGMLSGGVGVKRVRDELEGEEVADKDGHLKKKRRSSVGVKRTKGPTAKDSRAVPRPKHPDIFYTSDTCKPTTSNTNNSKTTTSNKPTTVLPSPLIGEDTTTGSSGCGSTPIPDIGSSVMARWTDKHWYPGTVAGENKNGKLNIDFADGSKGQVVRAHTFPLESLKEGVPVTAVFIQDRGVKETRGVFAGLDKESPQQFFIRVGADVSTFDLDTLCLPPDSAVLCTCKEDTEIDARKRRRPVRPSPTQEEPASKRKKLNAPKLPLRRALNDSTSKPPTQQKIFAGYYIILTHKPVDDKIADSPSPGPVNKELVSSQIRSRGGFIVDSFVDRKIIKGRYLVVSDCHCRTQKYLLALALGVPIISYSWVKDCVAQNKVIGYEEYRLPAGDAVGGGPPVEWTPRERSSILHGVNICIHGSSDVFKNRWSVIVKEAGARLLSKLPSVNQMIRSNNVASDLCNMIVICETHQLSSSMIHRATNSGLKLVDSEWVVQSLIHGRRLENYQDFWFDH